MALRTGIADERGMTLVEVMVAMVILVVGALGVISMLDTGNAVTRENLARDAATGLAREQLERAREMAYASLAYPNTVAGALATVLDETDAPIAATFVTRRRGVSYTTTITTCVLDDPSDGIGAATGTACAPLDPDDGGGGTTVPVNGTSGSLLGVNVLGIPISGTGSVVDAVCALLGRDSVLDALVGHPADLISPLVSTGADVGVCSSGSPVVIDRQANDATAVTSTVTWSSPRPGRVVQRAVIGGPRVTTAS